MPEDETKKPNENTGDGNDKNTNSENNGDSKKINDKSSKKRSGNNIGSSVNRHLKKNGLKEASEMGIGQDIGKEIKDKFLQEESSYISEKLTTATEIISCKMKENFKNPGAPEIVFPADGYWSKFGDMGMIEVSDRIVFCVLVKNRLESIAWTYASIPEIWMLQISTIIGQTALKSQTEINCLTPALYMNVSSFNPGVLVFSVRLGVFLTKQAWLNLLDYFDEIAIDFVIEMEETQKTPEDLRVYVEEVIARDRSLMDIDEVIDSIKNNPDDKKDQTDDGDVKK
jgi:hypothetical protein